MDKKLACRGSKTTTCKVQILTRTSFTTNQVTINQKNERENQNEYIKSISWDIKK